jgi:hypothetical protein
MAQQKKYGGFKDLYAILKRKEPQPMATMSAAAVNAWMQAVLDYIDHVEATRSVHHQIGPRLKNMKAFITRENSKKVIVKAGRFMWLIARLSQNQDNMKRTLSSNDPLVKVLYPGLLRRIDKGKDLLPHKFWVVHDKLKAELAADKK